MFESVKNALGGSGVTLENGGMILVSETATASANGLVSHFLSWGISNNHPVCFVTLQQTWSHYCNIGNKLGVNLRQHAEKGHVKVIEGLKMTSEVLDGVVEDISDHPFGFLMENCKYPLKNLYCLIKDTVKLWKEKYFLLIVDSITSLLSLGVTTKDLDIFIQYCSSLINHSSAKPIGLLVLVTNYDEKDEDVSHVTNSIAHNAIVHLSVRGLSTGLSREVHGDLKLILYDRQKPHLCLPKVQHFQYKMEDKNIKLFAPGTSACVL